MLVLISISFIIGYVSIAFEQKLKINKAAIAILLAIVCWGLLFIYNRHQDSRITTQLNEHLADIAQILFFLIGAMTIVETRKPAGHRLCCGCHCHGDGGNSFRVVYEKNYCYGIHWLFNRNWRFPFTTVISSAGSAGLNSTVNSKMRRI